MKKVFQVLLLSVKAWRPSPPAPVIKAIDAAATAVHAAVSPEALSKSAPEFAAVVQKAMDDDGSGLVAAFFVGAGFGEEGGEGDGGKKCFAARAVSAGVIIQVNTSAPSRNVLLCFEYPLRPSCAQFVFVIVVLLFVSPFLFGLSILYIYTSGGGIYILVWWFFSPFTTIVSG